MSGKGEDENDVKDWGRSEGVKVASEYTGISR